MSSEANPQAGAGRPLPKKEADTFRNVVKHYEMKQYKKAVKQADSILKKFPNHGETLAMKGLTLNYMSKREEAHALVKEGLRNDMRSHVCWHVYGLLHRSDRNYNEAIKAYKQALRIDPGNLQILRDLSMLQIQMRDLEGFALTRNTLLSLKSNAKINWMAFALAKHLTGELEEAARVIDIYLGTLEKDSEELSPGFESSELAMYKNSILAEIPNNYQAALDYLAACENLVVDHGAWLMARATYQLKLKDYTAAKETVKALLDRGMTENHQVHSLYMCSLLELDDGMVDEALRLKGTRTVATMVPLTREQKAVVREAYQTELQPKFPHSHAVQRIPMTVFEGEDLKKAVDQRCRRDLSKGVPSLCAELKSLIWVEENGRFVRPDDPVDMRVHPVYKMIVDLVDGYIANLLSISKFSMDDDTEESPATILWAWYLRAGLHEMTAEYIPGIALLDKCIEHTPTAVDVYELKAELLKAAGDIAAAVECLDKGRDLDRQDRYINNLTTKFQLQAGMEDKALKTISLFAKHEGNPEQNLFDMQCSWYELEVAACHYRKKAWGRALKKYAAVVKHFDDINEDQFDFHGYCLRKVTLRSYIDVLRFEDEAYGQEPYYCAAAGIIRIYLHLFDKPVADESEEPDYSNMSAAERKKAKAIARKKKKAAEKKENEHNESKDSNGNTKKSGKSLTVDVDPEGKELLKKDPLEEATKYSAMLVQYAPKQLQTWLLRYDVAIRRKKALMALQALHKARTIDATSCELLPRIVSFASQSFDTVSDPVHKVLVEETASLLGHKSVQDFVKDAVAAVAGDALTPLSMRVAVAKAMVDTKVALVKDACAVITKGGLDGRDVSVKTCAMALVTLQSFGKEAEPAAKEWTVAVRARFPLLKDLV